MALTEIQLPTLNTFYNRLRAAANEMDRAMATWKYLAAFVDNVTTADLDAMGVAAGQVRTDMVNFQLAIDDMIALYQGGTVTPTIAPEDAVALIRSM